jgi:hypothetical protein
LEKASAKFPRLGKICVKISKLWKKWAENFQGLEKPARRRSSRARRDGQP